MFHVEQTTLKSRTLCPVCEKEGFDHYLNVKDHFLSQSDFAIMKCKNCDFLFTNPYPDESSAGAYYKSNDYLSHPKSGFSLFSLAYSFIRKINIKSKYNSVTHNLKKGRVLDIGCGAGDFLHYCKLQGWEISGLELDEDARNFSSKKLDTLIRDPKEIAKFDSQYFDLITMWHVLEHVDDLVEQMQQLKRVLKPGGRLVLALPNYKSFDADYYSTYWAGWDVPRHIHHFDKNTIQLLANRFGFSLTETIPMRWDAYYVALLSEKYRKSSFGALKAFVSGCKSNRKAKKNMEFSSLSYIFEAV